jgi:hypothetical protein
MSFRFKKGMEVKIGSSNTGAGVRIMKTGIVSATDWPFVAVLIDGEKDPQCFFRNDVYPLNYYNC